MKLCSLPFLLLAFSTTACVAEVKLPAVFSDHAVMQREKALPVWGWAASGEVVKVKFHKQKMSVTAGADGRWMATLKPEKAGGPYELTVSGSQSTAPLTRTDIMVGDVWLASGQSNMEFPLTGFLPNAPMKNGPEEIAAATQPTLRLLLVKKTMADAPAEDIAETWTLCTPETAKKFSAIGYLFGRAVSAKEHVTVGMIDSTWGGTPAQSWTSVDALKAGDFGQITDPPGGVQKLRVDAKGKVIPQRVPGVLYNGMIAPFTHYALKGFIWYQGEADSKPEEAKDYHHLFSTMITDWRAKWGDKDLPFLWVQLSSFTAAGSEWGMLRDAQRRTLSLPNTGMAVSLDVGEAKNIHPADKLTVGKRLAEAALTTVYGEKPDGLSPEFAGATVEGSAMRVTFHDATALAAPSGTVGGFEVAGADHQFVPATATVEMKDGKATVVAKAESVSSPMYVRYGWSNVVTDYLYNSENLPLGTFTSEPLP